MLTIACCLVVGLGLGIGLALVSGWLVVMDVYSYHFFCHCHIDSRVEIPGRDDGVTRTTSIMSQPAHDEAYYRILSLSIYSLWLILFTVLAEARRYLCAEQLVFFSHRIQGSYI